MHRDGSIWTKIDLKNYKNVIGLKELKRIISTFGSTATKELMLAGSFVADEIPNSNHQNRLRSKSCPVETHKLSHLDVEFFGDYLMSKTENLNSIHLEYLDLSQVKFDHFLNLPNLSSLSLVWCHIKSNWFGKDSDEDCSNLKTLCLIRTGHLVENDVENICKRAPKLSTLVVNQAESSLNDTSIRTICGSLSALENLDLINTSISDNAIFSICESPSLSSNLKRLNLSMSSKISNNSIAYIAERLLSLHTLYLTSCFGISSVSSLKNFTNLRYLNINNTSIAKEHIKETLLPMLPDCEIEHGHEKMLSHKLMWTINGNRNCVCSV